MAENLHNDPFEEFLKKSLADHEEPAPADMWGSIERQLPAPPAGGTWLGLHRGAWWAVAATLFVAVVTWQFVRYEHRIGQLEEALRQQQDSIAHLRTEWLANQRNEELTKPRYEVTPQRAVAPTHRLPANDAPTASPEFFPAERHTTSPATLAQDEGTELPPSQSPPTATPEPKESPRSVTAPPADDRRQLGTLAALSLLPPAAVQPLDTRRWQPEVPPLPVLPQPMLQAPRSGHAVAAQWTQLQTTRQTLAFKEEPFGSEKAFYDSTRVEALETMAGLSWEMPLKGRWQLYTGLHLRQSSLELVHQPEFKYGEGKSWDPPHHMGGPHGHGPHHEQAFYYNLNTANGVLSLRLAVAPQDTLQPVSPDEPIQMEVRLRQRTRYLAIPIGIQYRQPLGRLSIACTAGLMANLLVGNEATLLDVQSMHPFFVPDKQAFDLKTPYARDLYLEGVAGIRLEYQPTRHWRIGAGPTLAGLLTSPHKAWYIQTKGWSVGWSASVQRLF